MKESNPNQTVLFCQVRLWFGKVGRTNSFGLITTSSLLTESRIKPDYLMFYFLSFLFV